MAIDLKCLRCETPMELGFQVDMAHMNVLPAHWTAGEPQPSFWGLHSVRQSQVKAGIPIRSYRCPKCGYLESYALNQPSSNS